MAKSIDPRRLRPADLLRLVNGTGVAHLPETRLRRHRNRAGYTIGDARTVDLFKYAAWLTLEYCKPKGEAGGYEQHKKRMAEQAAAEVRAAQDIGELPDVADPQRRAVACQSFRLFCETYFPEVFYLPWSPDHDKVVGKIERAVLTGGLFAVAMPRGSGKTVLMQMACLWSALIGATPFVTLIAASADRAKNLLENIKIWLETNTLLAADFPEVCFPIKALERITNRQKGQKFQGEPTRIEWSADKVVLPTVPGSKASGVVISCSGMKGSDIRGQNHARADGKVVRPQLVMVDDPQTTESAWSPSQSQRREAILAGDVLGMAGPGKKIAGLMACTVKVSVASTEANSLYSYAKIMAAAATLEKAPAGPARIISIEAGTGNKWAVVSFGHANPITWAKATDDWTNAAGNGSYVDASPCDDGSGTTVDTATSIKVWLPRNGLQKDPNIREDAIFPVALGPDGEYFCTGDYLDEEIGAVKIWHSTTIPAGWQLATGFGGRFLVGYDATDTDHDAVGETGGADTHTHAGHDNHANHGDHADHADHDDHPGTQGNYPGSQPFTLNAWDDPPDLSHSSHGSHGAHSAHSAHSAHDTVSNKPNYRTVVIIERVD